MSLVGQEKSVSSCPPDPIQEKLEMLLFQATNPSNKAVDVNIIKQFCDTVNMSASGPLMAARLLGHRVQSPQQQEALLALAVLEATVKSCGKSFHIEIGKFRFLNELIKLVSPKYLGNQTPNHVKLKVIELLFSWTKEIPGEAKILEAYEMLKLQGAISSDPDYVLGSAVFPVSLPPRQEPQLDQEQMKRLQKLLHSKNPEDIEVANRMIKEMVKKDEDIMLRDSKRFEIMESVSSNVKLLNEMLDCYREGDANNSEDRQLMSDVCSTCEKLRPGLYRMAGELEDGNEAISEILTVSDELTKVIDRYRDVIVLGKPDPHIKQGNSNKCVEKPDSLLDLSLNFPHVTTKKDQQVNSQLSSLDSLLVRKDILTESPSKDNISLPYASKENISLASASKAVDLLSDFSPQNNKTDNDSLLSLINVEGGAVSFNTDSFKPESATKGLDELDILGESLMKQSLPENSSLSVEVRRNEKLPLNQLKANQVVIEAKDLTKDLVQPIVTNSKKSFVTVDNSDNETKDIDTKQTVINDTKPENDIMSLQSPLDLHTTPNMKITDIEKDLSLLKPSSNLSPNLLQPQADLKKSDIEIDMPKIETPSHFSPCMLQTKHDFKISDIEIDMSTIKPSSNHSPITLQDGTEKGLTVMLYFTTNIPMEGVNVMVITFINHNPFPVHNLEFKPVVGRGIKVKLMPPSDTSLPAFNPFTPPSSVTQILILGSGSSSPVSLSYVLSYTLDDEPVTDMGRDVLLPISQ